MEFKDYYDTLGVKPEATDAQIKAAYRKLARKFHPDVSKESGAEEKFKSVNEAYEALKEPSRRKSYDQLRAGGYRAGEEFRGAPPNWQRGAGVQEEGDFSDFFESVFGNRTGGGRANAGPRRGRDLHAQLTVDLARAYEGGRERISLRDGQGDRTLEVKIPAGVLPGQQIRLAGQGSPGIQGAPSGDLMLEISVDDDPQFHLQGRDVLLTLPISPWEAALGATVTVPTLGGEVELKVPPGSNSGSRMRLRGRGMPGKTPGDQLVTLEVYAPAPQNEGQRKLYEQLARAFETNPRGAP